jgi:RNA polymerase sigma-70 factor (ECF subfamily)
MDLGNPDPRIDALLAVRCQLGERSAFDELIRRWAQPLRRHVARVAGDAHVADELVQDIWLRVVQGIGRLQDPGKFRPWLFGIAHRRLMDELRGRYAAPASESDEALEGLAAEPPDTDPELLARELERGLARLPASERDVLSLFYLEDLSLADVAQALAVPVGTVKSRLFRARQLLRLELTGDVHG